MEMFPYLRLFPRRLLLYLYFACVMFLVCAFYTIYTESHTPYRSNSLENVLMHNNLNSISNRWADKRHGESIPRKDDAVLPIGTIYLTTFTNNTKENTSEHLNSIRNKFNVASSSKLDTKYIYLTNPQSTTVKASTATTSAVLKRTTVLPDTCRTFSAKNSKLILLWTPFFQEWNYMLQENFGSCKMCRNCRVTNDRTKLSESDAVIFHARDMSLSDIPTIRYPHQRWIFFCLESPPYSDFPGMDYMANMFNWTMTYRTDSDIVTQYGTVNKIHPSRKLDLQSLRLAFNTKIKSVVWMSSHCPTHGGRDNYVDELRNYIDVDVYGKCGSLSCPPNSTEKCLRDFSSKYKFFLAFENTICRDYVTEKFFRTLEYNMVPVVFGGASYSKFAPPGSYIDALSFKTPRHLAFFLAGVGSDFNIYSSYFRWRKDFVVDREYKKECDLCEMLHKKDSKPSTYSDFRHWWVKDGNCRTWKLKR